MARLWRVLSWLLWVVTAVIIALLVLRFGMRALGVRDDIAFPGFVYALTNPLVEPFYAFFPVSDRFDYYAIEAASPVAAGVVLAGALLIYAVGLLVSGIFKRRTRDSSSTTGEMER